MSFSAVVPRGRGSGMRVVVCGSSEPARVAVAGCICYASVSWSAGRRVDVQAAFSRYCSEVSVFLPAQGEAGVSDVPIVLGSATSVRVAVGEPQLTL